jgi:hypothetical protein
MKTLTKDNVSIFVFDDAEVLSITKDDITVGDPVKFIIADCNSSNTELHLEITVPEDWAGHKYFFDGTNWTLNPDWIDPATIEQQTPEELGLL